jgi:hypothetical protein
MRRLSGAEQVEPRLGSSQATTKRGKRSVNCSPKDASDFGHNSLSEGNYLDIA